MGKVTWAMKKKAMKKSVIAKGKRAKAMVLRGSKEKTSGGLKKDNLRKNKGGKTVSKKASDRAKKAYAGSALQKWAKACQAARKELGLKGMVPMGGKTAQGRALYAKTKALYKACRNIWEAYSCDFRPRYVRSWLFRVACA